MPRDQIRLEIKRIVADIAGLESHEIADDAAFVDDLGLDSLTLLEIAVDVDYAFKLDIGEERLAQLTTIPEAVTLVSQCLAPA